MIKFHQFERASELLEHYTIDEIKNDSAILESAGLAQSDIAYIEELNEGFLGRLLDKLKNAISKHIPGGKLKKVEAALKTYKSNMEDALAEELKLRKDILGEKVEDTERRKKIDKMMKRVNNKLDEYKKRAEDEFKKMTKGEPERISDYISMRLAEVQAEVTKQELDSARENAKLYTEEEQTKIKEEKEAKEKAAKEKTAEIEKKTKEEEEKKKKKGKDVPEMTTNDKAYLKKLDKEEGEVYKRKSEDGKDQEAEILAASAEKQEVYVKILNKEKEGGGDNYWVKSDSLKDKIEKKTEEPEKKKEDAKPEEKKAEDTKPEDKKEEPKEEPKEEDEPDKKFTKGARVKYEDKKGNIVTAKVLEQPTKGDAMVQIQTDKGNKYPIAKDRLEKKKNKRRRIEKFKQYKKAA